MNGADIILLLILISSAGLSYYNGLVQEVLSLATWLLAFSITILFLYPFSLMIADFIPYLDLRLAISIVGLFILSFIPTLWINYLIIDSLGRQKISSADRFLSAILGLARGILIILFILFLAALTENLPNSHWWQSSIMIQQFSKIALSIIQFLPLDMTQQFHF